jgi:predicted HicB family RNase H-like nuclease
MTNYSLEELKILNAKLSEEIEKKESESSYSKHQGGRPKKASISYKKTELRIDKDLYYNLSILAEIDGRSTNSIICKILERYVNDPSNYQTIKTFNEHNEKSM